MVAEPSGGGGPGPQSPGPPPKFQTEANNLSDQTPQTPLDDAAQHTAEAIEQTHAAVEEVVADVVEDVAEAVTSATEDAQEAATEAAEVIEDAVEDAVEGAAEVPNDMANDVYNMVMARLREDGAIPSAPLVEEIAGTAIDETTEVIDGAVAAPDDIAPVIEEAAEGAARDTIRPRGEHWYTRPRRFLGREW